MKYQKNYYYFKSALSNVLCDKIIKEGMSNNQKSAGVGYIDPKTKFELEEVKKKRDSNISWIGDVWLKRLLKLDKLALKRPQIFLSRLELGSFPRSEQIRKFIKDCKCIFKIIMQFRRNVAKQYRFRKHFLIH